MHKIIPTVENHTSVRLYSHGVKAGFPSPAEDYVEKFLDLNEHLVRHPAATYFVRADGDSMISYGIFNRDILIVSRSLEATNGDIVIAAVDGQLTCKVLDTKNMRLLSGNDLYPPIPVKDLDLIIEGVVTHSIRYHK